MNLIKDFGTNIKLNCTFKKYKIFKFQINMTKCYICW